VYVHILPQNASGVEGGFKKGVAELKYLLIHHHHHHNHHHVHEGLGMFPVP
jgi:hypothetical protein